MSSDPLLTRRDVPLSVLQNFIRYRDNPWAFVTECCYSKDQTNKKNPIALLPNYDYLKLYSKVRQRENKMLVPKSRRMTMSWTTIALYLHEVIFFQVRDMAFVSKKEEDAGELVKRAEFIFDNIPENKIPRKLLPRKETRAKPQTLSFPEIMSKIQGFAMSADQLRQFTLSGILGDECAFWPEGMAFYNSAIPTIEGGGRIDLISSRSPSFFQRLVYDQIDNQDPIDEENTPPKQYPFGDDSVIIWKNPKNGFLVFDIHYTANPNKRSPGFKEKVKNQMPLKDFLVEYERNWEAYDGKPVFEDYNKLIHEVRRAAEPELGLPLLIGWDFGLTPAAVVAQLQGNRLVILREFVSRNKGIRQFAPEVMNTLRQQYPMWNDPKRDFLSFVDPAGFSRSQDNSESSCVIEMGAQGIKNIFPGPVSWEDRRKAVEHFLIGMSGGKPNFSLYAKDCPKLSKGLGGAYRYPDKYGILEPGNPKPLKDEYSHPADALQYLCHGAIALGRKSGNSGKAIPKPSYSFSE